MEIDHEGAPANPSEAEALQDAGTTQGTENAPAEGQETAPDPSTGADVKKPIPEDKWDPLSVVRKALDKDKSKDLKDSQDGAGKNGADASSQSGGDQDKTQTPAADDGSKDLSEDEKKLLHPKTRKRMDFLLGERQKLTDKVGEMEPQVEQFQNLTNYMREHKLQGAEVAELLVVGAMAKSGKPEDLETAITKTSEYLQKLKLAAGKELPDDLKQKVADGLVDGETAKQISLERAQAARTKADLTETTEQAAARDRETKISEVNQTVDEWQASKFKTDPDYQRKADLLQKEIQLRVSREPGGIVLDKNKALQIANEAYAEVENVMKKIAPPAAPTPKRVLPSRSGTGNMATQPKTALEAARAGLEKSRR